MSRIIKILSDYTSADNPNILTIHADDQGDFHISLYKGNDNESSVRIAQSGTRYSPRVREAFNAFMNAYQEELADIHCRPELKKLNKV